MLNKDQLINFEEEIAEKYNQGLIRAPIHLHVGAEEGLINIFKEHYKENDWIVSTHRAHYPWLLSGRSPEELKKQILEGHSMQLFDDKFITSSIVAGGASIAVGIALALKNENSKNKVLCFLGDAASECGIAKESIRYSEGHDLPILFIIENNEKCVNTNTYQSWGTKNIPKVIKFDYCRKYPHAGCGTYIMF